MVFRPSLFMKLSVKIAALQFFRNYLSLSHSDSDKSPSATSLESHSNQPAYFSGRNLCPSIRLRPLSPLDPSNFGQLSCLWPYPPLCSEIFSPLRLTLCPWPEIRRSIARLFFVLAKARSPGTPLAIIRSSFISLYKVFCGRSEPVDSLSLCQHHILPSKCSPSLKGIHPLSHSIKHGELFSPK